MSKETKQQTPQEIIIDAIDNLSASLKVSKGEISSFQALNYLAKKLSDQGADQREQDKEPKGRLTSQEYLDSKNITTESSVWFTANSDGNTEVEGYDLIELLNGYALTQQPPKEQGQKEFTSIEDGLPDNNHQVIAKGIIAKCALFRDGIFYNLERWPTKKPLEDIIEWKYLV